MSEHVAIYLGICMSIYIYYVYVCVYIYRGISKQAKNQITMLPTSSPYRCIARWDERQIQEGHGTGGTVGWAL